MSRDSSVREIELRKGVSSTGGVGQVVKGESKDAKRRQVHTLGHTTYLGAVDHSQLLFYDFGFCSTPLLMVRQADHVTRNMGGGGRGGGNVRTPRKRREA